MNVAEHKPPPDKVPESKEVLTIENISFKKVQGIWVPVKGHVICNVNWPKHGFFYGNEINFEVTEILLNPDHKALESFADPMENPSLDPKLVNGTRVTVGEERTRCVWRNGKRVEDSSDPVR